jgi:CRP-like cAMP-binding protein
MPDTSQISQTRIFTKKLKMHDLILANFAMHISLDVAETAHVKALLQHKSVKKNTLLLSSGEICRQIYFVNKGCLRIFNTDKEGLEHNISFCPENWWAVDISSFSGQVPAFYNIGAMEDTDVFYLRYSALEQLYTDVPKFERFFRILTQNGFNLYQRRITSNLSKTAEERYLQFQKQYPKLEQRIAQKQIASYLGITPVFLSMIRKKK